MAKVDSHDVSHDIIKDTIKKEHLNMMQISARLGEIPQSLGQQMRDARSFKFNRFCEIMATMGYKVSVEPIGYCVVSKSYTDSVMETHNPAGLYVTPLDDGRYRVVDNREYKGSEIIFLSEGEMIAWLEATIKR